MTPGVHESILLLFAPVERSEDVREILLRDSNSLICDWNLDFVTDIITVLAALEVRYFGFKLDSSILGEFEGVEGHV